MARQTTEQQQMAQRAADELGITLPSPGVVQTPGNASTPTPSPTGAFAVPNIQSPQVQTPAFIEALTERLIGQSGIVSSLNTDLEETFTRAAEGVNTAADANRERIESAFNREIDFGRRRADQAFQSAVEGQRGFATQRTALISLEEETQKNLKDLEQRKQELILQGEADAARQLSQLQVDAIKTKIDAQKTFFNQLLQSSEFVQSQFNTDRQFAQQQFENILNVAQFQEEVRQFETNRQFQQQQFAENSRRFNLNFALDQEQFQAGEEQRLLDNQFREQQFAQTLREFDETKRLNDAQISKIYKDITPQYTAGGITMPGAGAQGTNQLFVPNRKLTVDEQKKINSATTAISLINQLEAHYDSATKGEYASFGSGLWSRVKGVARTAGSFLGTPGFGPVESGEDWAVYDRFLNSNRAPIAKGIKGEVGNLAQQEQLNALKSFPGRFSSPQEAEAAFESVRQQVLGNLEPLGSFHSQSSGRGMIVTAPNGQQIEIVD